VIVRKLEYLIALAKEEHFARAAAACHVSQPTLSEGIHQLEVEMGVLIVKRGQRYQGLTDEGERVLAWAQRMSSECERLRQELRERTGHLNGTLRIGVVPSALPLVSHFTGPFQREHPQVTLRIMGLSPSEIQHQFDEFSLDAAITYLDSKVKRFSHLHELYHEDYALLTRKGTWTARQTIGWRDLVKMRLCFLTPDMYPSGSLLREMYNDAQDSAVPHIDTNSVTALYSCVRSGEWSAVLPVSMIDTHDDDLEARRLPPLAESVSVGIAVPDREPACLLASAFFQSAASNGMAAAIQASLSLNPGTTMNEPLPVPRPDPIQPTKTASAYQVRRVPRVLLNHSATPRS
jgi:DNA-binding transcriptional LysR family regulator